MLSAQAEEAHARAVCGDDERNETDGLTLGIRRGNARPEQAGRDVYGVFLQAWRTCTIRCFEYEYEKDGVVYMDIYVYAKS